MRRALAIDRGHLFLTFRSYISRILKIAHGPHSFHSYVNGGGHESNPPGGIFLIYYKTQTPRATGQPYITPRSKKTSLLHSAVHGLPRRRRGVPNLHFAINLRCHVTADATEDHVGNGVDIIRQGVAPLPIGYSADAGCAHRKVEQAVAAPDETHVVVVQA